MHIPSLCLHLQVHTQISTNVGYTQNIYNCSKQLLATVLLFCREHTRSIFAPLASSFNTTAYAACMVQMLPTQVCHNNKLRTNRGVFFISNFHPKNTPSSYSGVPQLDSNCTAMVESSHSTTYGSQVCPHLKRSKLTQLQHAYPQQQHDKYTLTPTCSLRRPRNPPRLVLG